ncbi:hypothetical protein DVR12_12185 [Chitinophaga silvatica]|uniref:GyrI-like small molecule binding domain-containing protein n=1 Tax=Chitinophaga silvatica TaxID=2282649 RepID=A0A3E1YA41_9BACT|nr:GyrI-like domain-containing protein [Chitinophaga silvatica]RFS22555.1 hypothetical protein DVR12_12185 [Chitinophaga silvatica]
MVKLDLTKAFKKYFTATPQPQLVNIEKGLYLTITGQGDPDGEGFASSISALYSIAYAIKFSNKEKGKDFVVCKLEGFWWVDVKNVDPLTVPRSEWHYELAIMLPDDISQQQFEMAVKKVIEKKKSPLASQVELKKIEEGLSIQILHEGPFKKEPETLAILHNYILQEGYTMHGRHHEIYLSDFRKTAPEKLKTILRYPVRK